MFYFKLHNLSNQSFKNLILIGFTGIGTNYLYVYQTNSFKNELYEFF